MLSPTSVTVDNTGNIFFADGNNVIRKINKTTGIITTVAGDGTTGYSGDGGLAVSAELHNPYGVFVENATGNLYIAEESNQRVRKVSASTGIITTVAGNGTAGYNGDNILATSASLANPVSASTDNAGNLYISDYANSRIRKVDGTTGLIFTIAGTSNGGSYNGDGIPATSANVSPFAGIVAAPNGDVYFGEGSYNRIRKISGLY